MPPMKKKLILLILSILLTPIIYSQATNKVLNDLRTNFTRINQINDWKEIKTMPLNDESSEGGEINFYYSENGLEKIITTHFGEMGTATTEYYLLNNELSFVFEIIIQYNSPFYLTETNTNSIEIFDPTKSSKIENRHYFYQNKIIKQILDSKCAESPAECKKKDQERLLENFNTYKNNSQVN